MIAKVWPEKKLHSLQPNSDIIEIWVSCFGIAMEKMGLRQVERGFSSFFAFDALPL